MPNPADILRTLGGKLKGNKYPEIEQFLRGKANNAWIESGGYKAYLRKGMPGRVDLASIERKGLGDNALYDLPPEQRPPRGDFSGFMAELERAAADAGYDQVYVENIMNEFLPGVLERMGYSRDPDALSAFGASDAIPSMLKALR